MPTLGPALARRYGQRRLEQAQGSGAALYSRRKKRGGEIGGVWFSAYLGSYGSDEGFVERTGFVQVHHRVGACLAAQSSLVISRVSPF